MTNSLCAEGERRDDRRRRRRAETLAGGGSCACHDTVLVWGLLFPQRLRTLLSAVSCSLYQSLFEFSNDDVSKPSVLFLFFLVPPPLPSLPTGCAFVTFSTRAMAQNAIKAMHQSQTMEVRYSPPLFHSAVDLHVFTLGCQNARRAAVALFC